MKARILIIAASAAGAGRSVGAAAADRRGIRAARAAGARQRVHGRRRRRQHRGVRRHRRPGARGCGVGGNGRQGHRDRGRDRPFGRRRPGASDDVRGPAVLCAGKLGPAHTVRLCQPHLHRRHRLAEGDEADRGGFCRPRSRRITRAARPRSPRPASPTTAAKPAGWWATPSRPPSSAMKTSSSG